MLKIKLWFSVVKGWLLPWSSAFEEVAGVLMGYVNELIVAPNVTANIKRAKVAIETAVFLMKRYADWCPAKWRSEYDAIVGLTSEILDVFSDDRIDVSELEHLIKSFKDAYLKWNEED